MSFLTNMFIGLIIGIGFIIPGVSGGALAVLLGVYDKIIVSINNIRLDFKKNIVFLMTILLGILIGTIGFSKILLFLLEKREVPTKFIFIGLVIGGIPSLIKNVKCNSNSNLKWSLVIISIVISFVLFVIEKTGLGINLELELSLGYVPVFQLLIAGFLYAVGKIVPGVSGAALLMLVGMYKYLLTIISNPFAITKKELLVLLPFIIGALFGIIILFKLINSLLNKHYIKTYSAIIGFVIGSLFYLFPSLKMDYSFIFCILLVICSAIISYKMTK